MKLGILTQQLHCNYGGLLQAWALQQTLTRMGHEAWIIRREIPRPKDINIFHRYVSSLYHGLLQLIGREQREVRISEQHAAIIRQYTNRFIESKYTHLTPLIYNEKDLREYIYSNGFDGYVVGSDQVWRPKFSPAIGNFFLDFAKNISGIKRIAYAASFGVDSWEYNSKETAIAKELAPLFDMISVREDSGIKLVKDYLGLDAYHVLDPTMLMSTDDYKKLITSSTSHLKESNGELFSYVLDSKESVQNIIDIVVKATHYRPYYCYAKRRVKTREDLLSIDECVMPPVEQWIKSFIDAKMVITDSFHGTVFSIIFNKPFWVVINEERGASRFRSLLSLYNLDNRIVTSQTSTDWHAPIDWEIVNSRREEFRKRSINLLNESLKCNKF
jgi:hypothetical protein